MTARCRDQIESLRGSRHSPCVSPPAPIFRASPQLANVQLKLLRSNSCQKYKSCEYIFNVKCVFFIFPSTESFLRQQTRPGPLVLRVRKASGTDIRSHRYKGRLSRQCPCRWLPSRIQIQIQMRIQILMVG